MNKLTVYSATGQAIQELDIGEEITAPFSYKLADIRKPDVKSGSHTKTIRLPGTKNNNMFFGGLYDVNADYTVFNPALKTWVRWVSGDEEILSGYMKLNKVLVNDQKDITYEVVLFDTTVDFWNSIEGKYFFELGNISELSHFWTGTNIKASWSTDWNQLGYFYPALQNSLGAGNSQSVTYTERMYPAIFHMRALDMIIRDAGYTWSGSLRQNAVYQREIIPYTGDHPNITLSSAAGRTFKAGRNSNQVGNYVFTNPPNSGKMRSSRVDWNYLGAVQFPDESGGTYGFNDFNGLWSSEAYTAPENGQYAFNLQLNLRGQLNYSKTGNPTNSLDYAVNFMVYAEINTGAQTFLSNGVPLTSFTWYFAKGLPNTTAFAEQNLSNSLVFPASSVLQNNTNGNYFVLNGGWSIRFLIGYSSQGLKRAKSGNPPFYANSQDENKNFQINSFNFRMNAGTFVECNDSMSAYGQGSFIPYEAFINRKMLCKDLFSDLIARYNIHIYTNPDKEKDLIIDTGETFYDPDPMYTEDWSMLKENDELDEIQHMSELQNERFLLTYSDSDDNFSKQYKGNTGETYGQYEHRFTNAFVKGVLEVKTPFVETPIIEINGRFFPAVEQGNKDGAMRVLYAPKNGVTMINAPTNTPAFVLIASDGQHTMTNPFNYPYAGHYQNPNRVNNTTVYNVNDDNDINFGSNAYLFPNLFNGVNSLPVDTLERRYWSRRIDQMNRGKMLKTSLNLTSRHINLIRKRPYTRIWLNKAYWQVNLINYEGNDQLRKLTPVEFVSIHNLLHYAGKIPKPTKPTLTDWGSVFGTISSTTNKVGNGTIKYDIKGNHNVLLENSSDIIIVGNGNIVGGNLTNVNIQSSNNIKVYGSNVTVIASNDLTILSDNVTVINNVLYDGDRTVKLFNLVDGGEDELRPLNSKSKINLIDSGKNINLNKFSDEPINLIDSDTGLNDKISIDGISNRRRENKD